MIKFIADRVGAKPTHIIAVEAGRIVALRATCGGRRVATVADPTGSIRRGEHMQRSLPVARRCSVAEENTNAAARVMTAAQEAACAAGPDGGWWAPAAFRRAIEEAEERFAEALGIETAAEIRRLDRDAYWLTWEAREEQARATVRARVIATRLVPSGLVPFAFDLP